MHLLDELAQLGSPRILVVGDLILDRYTWGDAERISPEAPVIVLRADRREIRLGGAANVCQMVRGLEGQAACAGVVGGDSAGGELRQLLAAAAVDTQLVVTDVERPTTVKDRIIGRAGGRHPNQMVRVDYETRAPLDPALERRLIDGICSQLGQFDVLLISDYAKGVCTQRLLVEVIRAARASQLPVLVDPARSADLSRYRGATLVKPNRSESQLATGLAVQGAADALRAGQQLCRELDLELAVITLDRDGIVLVERSGASRHYATRARAVYDVTGAGDVVLAMLGIGLGSGRAARVAVELANVAGGLEVEHTGAAIVTRSEIAGQLAASGRAGLEKIQRLEPLAQRLAEHRGLGERVVFTNGCFDLLHVGHVSYLAEAAALGQRLVVAINSDASVQRLKGPGRPVIGQQDRAALLAALSAVDYVIIFDQDTPHRLLETLRPDVLVKGGTYTADQVVGAEVVRAYGGLVTVTGAIDGVSTSDIIHRVAGEREQAA